MVFRSSLSMAVLLLAGSMVSADELTSGPQVGEQATKFGALFLNGDQAGRRRCPV